MTCFIRLTWLCFLFSLAMPGCQHADEVNPGDRGRIVCELGGQPGPDEERILFGDLHVHSTNSLDALLIDMPVTGGLGNRTPDNLCDFARYCSQVDFWNLSDHAEEQLVSHWQENVEAVRNCNQRYGGYDHQPELVSFLGWEWTCNSLVAEPDYGHRNVVLKHTCDADIPARPIAAPSGFAGVDEATARVFAALLTSADPEHADFYDGVLAWVLAFQKKTKCDPAVDTRSLPADCHEEAVDPLDLYERLDRWGLDAFVIPHGFTWGSFHAADSSWLHQFERQALESRYARLVEIYSGHGNMEPYRAFRPLLSSGNNQAICPEPTADFEPCCHRAGELVRANSQACQDEPEGETCRNEVDNARQAFLAAGLDGITTVKGARPEDWLDCGQCRDCFQPALYHRPLQSVQTAMALSDLDDPANPWTYRFGLIGSTDSHRSGPGSGYKEFRRMSDGYGPAAEDFVSVVAQAGSLVTRDYERQNSFFYGGGLVAVHARGRSREAIWEALEQGRVYATSGDRIQAWFELVNGPDGQRLFMGSQARLPGAPQFEVRAIGAPVQAAGCPDWVVQARGEDFVRDVCFGECFNPTGERHLISRIEVVKVAPRMLADESLDDLIHDPYQVFDCDPDPAGCTVTFSDPDFPVDGRPAAYYARVIQEPTPQFNAGNLRCDRDGDGNCLASHRCQNGYRGEGDDCLADDEERAWTSPIYLTP